MAEYETSEEEEGFEPEDNSEKHREVWERALTRFDAVALPQQELRADSLLARRFVTIPGAQWEGAWGEQFENSPRPEVDKITKGLEKIETDYRQNRLTVDYVPADDAADEDTADTLDGLYRADADNYNAAQAHDNAFFEGLRGGFGAFRVCTVYEDPYDKENDSQRINPGVLIPDADQSVYFYGGVAQDGSDAEGCFVLSRELKQIAYDKWGEANCVPWSGENWKWQWDWYTPDVICIAEYYEVEETDDRLVILTDPQTEEDQRFYKSDIEPKEVADKVAEGYQKRERSIKRRRVHKYILNGTGVLKDCGYIAGDMIPVVPFYYRYEFVDNMPRWRGYVLKKMDRQRIYNSRIAKLVETDSLSPREVPIFDPSQIDAVMADEWARANIDRLPFLRANALRDNDGNIITAGPIGKVEPPQVQPATAALLQIAATDLADDDQNADEVKANVSAEAMDIAASRVDDKSAIPLDNFRLAITRLAVIYRAMAREVYFEPGRKVETLSLDGKMSLEKLAEPTIGDDGVFRMRNDLSRGKYKVVADVQESTSTKRQRTVRESLNIAEVASQAQDAELAQAAILTAVMNQDGEGMQDMQTFARNKAIAIGLTKPTPEEQQQIQQAQEANAQPSPADQALMAQAEELKSKAELNTASAAEKQAGALLKTAQATAVGGPEQAPEAPSGLSAANDEATIADRFAAAELKRAQADNIRHDMGEKRIRLGNELEDRAMGTGA